MENKKVSTAYSGLDELRWLKSRKLFCVMERTFPSLPSPLSLSRRLWPARFTRASHEA